MKKPKLKAPKGTRPLRSEETVEAGDLILYDRKWRGPIPEGHPLLEAQRTKAEMIKANEFVSNVARPLL